MDYDKITLKELLCVKNETIYRNAKSIFEQMLKKKFCTNCGYVEAQRGIYCVKCKREMTGII